MGGLGWVGGEAVLGLTTSLRGDFPPEITAHKIPPPLAISGATVECMFGGTPWIVPTLRTSDSAGKTVSAPIPCRPHAAGGCWDLRRCPSRRPPDSVGY